MDDTNEWATVSITALAPGWTTIRRTPDSTTSTTSTTSTEACPALLLQQNQSGTTRCVFATTSGGLIIPATDDPDHIETRWRRP
jgi:hypothetical protein